MIFYHIFFTSHFLYSGNTFLTVFFMSFDPFFLHFDFNIIAASNNSPERSLISSFLVDFIVDCIMCMYIRFITLSISNLLI